MRRWGIIVVAVGVLALLTRTDALANQQDSWTRRPVGNGRVTLELPTTWKIDPKRTEVDLAAREYPAGNRIAIFAAQSQRAQSGLDAWVTYYKSQQLPALHPEGRLVSEVELTVGESRGRLFRVTDLEDKKRDYELLQAVLLAQGRFVFLSLYHVRGASERYEKLLRHVIDSVEVSDSDPVSDASAPTSPTETLARTQIAWQSDFEDAFREARERHVPVLICFNMDRESACEQILKSHYADPKLVELSRQLVCLIASKFDHGGVEGRDGVVKACPRFGVVPCPDHRDIELRARETYLRSPKAIAPQHMLCAPDGRLLSRREYMLSKPELELMIRKAQVEVEKMPRSAAVEDFISEYEKATEPMRRIQIISDAFHANRPVEADRLVQKIVESRDPARLTEMIDALGYSGHAQAGQHALRYLDHASVDVRNHAAVAVEMTALKEAVSALKRRLGKERESRVRKNLLRALGACGRGDRAIGKLLLKQAKSGETLLRINAVLALKHFPGDVEVEKGLIDLLRREGNLEVRQVLAWTLGRLGSQAAIPTLEATAEIAGAGETRNLVLSAIHRIQGTLGDGEDFEDHIEGIAQDEIERVR